jgi:hypothetical protein
MNHTTRSGALFLVAGLALYVTGLQKLVLDPVLGWFGDLATGAQLAILVGVVAVVAVSLWLRRRRRLAELRRAHGIVADALAA